MKRLRDMHGAGDARIKGAADALRQIERTEPSSVAKARVWARLQKRPTAELRTPLRWIAVALVLVTSAALASGKVSWRHPLGLFMTRTSLTEPTTVPSIGVGANTTHPTETNAIAVENDAGATDANTIDVSAIVKPVPAPPHTLQGAITTVIPEAVTAMVPTSVSSTQFAPEIAQVDDESGLVLLGLSELRREHNPLKARQLFATYLTRHPNGPLAEDALGYSLEAADHTGAADAKALATQYLQSFPHGRYCDLATHVKNARGL